MITPPTLEMHPDRHETAARGKQDFTVVPDTDMMTETDNQQGMYEDLQNRLGKSYLEVHEMISAL